MNMFGKLCATCSGTGDPCCYVALVDSQLNFKHYLVSYRLNANIVTFKLNILP